METHGTVVERRWSMTARGMKDIPPGKPVYVYTANMTDKKANLLKLMIAAYASRAAACIIYVRANELHMLEVNVVMQTQIDKSNL